MKCPVCVEPDLVIADRSGIEIDYCPKCRGVWLDRGELDKIIERTSEFNDRADKPRSDSRQYPDQKYYEEKKYYDDDYYKRKKRKSILGELFDF
jgi:hypothetical protein